MTQESNLDSTELPIKIKTLGSIPLQIHVPFSMILPYNYNAIACAMCKHYRDTNERNVASDCDYYMWEDLVIV